MGDLVGLIMIAFMIGEGDFGAILMNMIVALVIMGILITTILVNIRLKFQSRKVKIGKTVDAVIEDDSGNIVLIQRKYPPFKDYYALPGGFIEKGETPEQALIREVKEETNLNVKIIGKIGVYDEKGRDPRGIIYSTAFKCKIIGDLSQMKNGADSQKTLLFSKEKVKKIELAFDHREILKDAKILNN